MNDANIAPGYGKCRNCGVQFKRYSLLSTHKTCQRCTASRLQTQKTFKCIGKECSCSGENLFCKNNRTRKKKKTKRRKASIESTKRRLWLNVSDNGRELTEAEKRKMKATRCKNRAIRRKKNLPIPHPAFRTQT